MRRSAPIRAAAAAVLLLLLASLAAQAAEFEARVRMTGPGDEIAGTIYVSGQKHSMLLEQAGRELVIFADREAGITRLVSVAAQAQTVLRADDRMLLMLDAFQSALHAHPGAASEVLGEEEFAGQACRKVRISLDGQPFLVRWDATALDFPIRVEMADGSRKAVLSEIEVGPVPERYFLAPEHFREVSFAELGDLIWQSGAGEAAPEPAAPGAAPSGQAAPPPAQPAVRSARFGFYLKAGDEVRLLLGPGTAARVSAADHVDPGFAWSAVPRRGGQALRAETDCRREGPGEVALAAGAEEVVVAARAGAAHLEVELEGVRPLRGRVDTFVLQGGSGKMMSSAWPTPTFSISVLGEPVAGSAVRTARGRLTIESDDPATRAEFAEVEFELADGGEWARTFTPAQLVTGFDLTVMVGRCRIRVEQGRPEAD